MSVVDRVSSCALLRKCDIRAKISGGPLQLGSKYDLDLSNIQQKAWLSACVHCNSD